MNREPLQQIAAGKVDRFFQCPHGSAHTAQLPRAFTTLLSFTYAASLAYAPIKPGINRMQKVLDEVIAPQSDIGCHDLRELRVQFDTRLRDSGFDFTAAISIHGEGR